MGRARPTILQIIPSLDTGGAELSTAEIAEAIVAAGGRALVATEGGRLAARIRKAGGEVLSFAAATKNPARLLANAGKLTRLIERENVSLIHARSRAPAWSALMAARRSSIPFVTTYHGAYAESGKIKRLYNSVMARADRVIANSGYTAGLIETRYGTDKIKVRVIHRGVNMTEFDPAAIATSRVEAMRHAWGVPPERPIILHAARLTSWKGQRVLLDAVARLVRGGLIGQAMLVFAGDDQGRTEYRDELVSLAAALGISNDVRFVGHVSDMAAAFALAHVAVVASIEPEAFGRTATEAQAMGCPVIATAIGAPPETVLAAGRDGIDHATGWLVPPGDADALAQCLDQALLLTERQRSDLGRRARAHVAANFTLDAMRRSTLAVYDELLGSELAHAWDDRADFCAGSLPR